MESSRAMPVSTPVFTKKPEFGRNSAKKKKERNRNQEEERIKWRGKEISSRRDFRIRSTDDRPERLRFLLCQERKYIPIPHAIKRALDDNSLPANAC